MSAPVDTLTLHRIFHTALARSLCSNRIGDEGASALAAILKKTKITDLECAADPQCSLLCQRPLTRLPSHLIHSAPRSHRLWGNHLIYEAEQALKDAVEYNKKAAKEVLRATLTLIPSYISLYLPISPYISPVSPLHLPYP